MPQALYNHDDRAYQLSLYGVAVVTYKAGRQKHTHEISCNTWQVRNGTFKADYERKFPHRTLLCFTYKTWAQIDGLELCDEPAPFQ